MLTKEEQSELELLEQDERAPLKVVRPTLSSAEKQELDALELEESENKGFGEQLLDGAIEVGNFIDSYTGAPTRAAISAAQNTKNPISAFANQFGEDPSKAATGKQIMQKAGVPDNSLSEAFPSLYTTDKEEADEWLMFEKDGPADITASGAAGLALDIVADPTTLVGGGLYKGAKAGMKHFPKAANTLRKGRLFKKSAKNLDKVHGSLDESAEMARKLQKLEKEANSAKGMNAALKSNSKDAAGHFDNLFNPRQAPDFDEMAEIAAKNGIDPQTLPRAVEFGENSFASSMQKFKAEGPLGEGTLNAMDQTRRMVDGAILKKIHHVGGEAPKGFAHGGSVIREGYDEAIETLAKTTDVTYGNIYKIAPGIELTDDAINSVGKELNNIERWAKGRVARGIPGEPLQEASHMIEVVGAIRKANGSIKQTVEVMQDIGEIAFKSKNYMEQTPKDIKRLRDLYFSLSDAVYKTVEGRLGPEMAKSLKGSNKAFKEFFTDSSFVKHIGVKTKSNEELFRNLIANGDTLKIPALKRLMPQKMQQLKGEFLGSLVKYHKNGEINLGAIRNALHNKREIVNALFSKAELKDFDDVLRLKGRLGDRVLSHSGTGKTNKFRDLFRSPVESVISNTTGDTLTQKYISSARNHAGREATKMAKAATKVEQLKQVSITLKTLSASEKLKRLAVFSPVAARLISSQSNKGELKGKNKWLLDGATRLVLSDGGFKKEDLEKIIASQKGQRLLASISGVGLGSVAMTGKIKSVHKFLNNKDVK